MSASITLPPTMLREVEQLAEHEGKTVSELLQKAVRRYLIQTQIRELQRYGKQQSGASAGFWISLPDQTPEEEDCDQRADVGDMAKKHT